MNRESFLDTVRQQYADEIQEAYRGCLHEGRLDSLRLQRELDRLMKSAGVEGLPAREFEELVQATLPSSVGRQAA
jgi:hypothetical protein